MQLTDTPTRMRNTARRLVNDEGMSQQHATWYIERFYGVSEYDAQVAVIDAVHPGGFEAWMMPPTDEVHDWTCPTCGNHVDSPAHADGCPARRND